MKNRIANYLKYQKLSDSQMLKIFLEYQKPMEAYRVVHNYELLDSFKVLLSSICEAGRDTFVHNHEGFNALKRLLLAVFEAEFHTFRISLLCRSHYLNRVRLAQLMKVMRAVGRVEYIAYHRFTRNGAPATDAQVITDVPSKIIFQQLQKYSEANRSSYSDISIVQESLFLPIGIPQTIATCPVSFSHGIPSPIVELFFRLRRKMAVEKTILKR